MNELTDKTYCLETISKKQIYINKEQADKIKQTLMAGTAKYITVEGQFLSVGTIDGIYHAEYAQKTEKKRRGEWECASGFWHERRQECGHTLAKRYD